MSLQRETLNCGVVKGDGQRTDVALLRRFAVVFDLLLEVWHVLAAEILSYAKSSRSSGSDDHPCMSSKAEKFCSSEKCGESFFSSSVLTPYYGKILDRLYVGLHAMHCNVLEWIAPSPWHEIFSSAKWVVLVWVVMENCDLSSDLTLRNV